MHRKPVQSPLVHRPLASRTPNTREILVLGAPGGYTWDLVARVELITY